MLNPFLDASANLFSLVSRLRGEHRGADLPEDYREELLSGFDMLERRAFELQLPLPDVQDVKYALTAFVDESVLSSEWPGRSRWMDDPLQIKFFGDHLAGERFFDRVSELRQNAERRLDVLEVYYLCLQMGFEGMYRLRGAESLMALQVDLRNQIETHRGTVEPRLSPAGIPHQGFISRVQRDVPYWVIASVTLALVVVAYSAYTVRVESFATENLARVDSHLQSIVLVRDHEDSGPATDRTRSRPVGIDAVEPAAEETAS